MVLVTGATGKLGTAVCEALTARGVAVRATDRRYKAGFVVPVELGDLCDEAFVYRVLDGCNAVVHLGNHPNFFVGPSPQRLLGDNVLMNANVFQAAIDLGLETIVFASSIQVMVRRDEPSAPPYGVAYLPLDGNLPPNPGQNTYAQSKEFAERMLRLLVQAHPALSATSLRFPMLVSDQQAQRMRSAARMPLSFLDLRECTAHLFLADAGRLVASVLERRRPGYHQYFPATAMDLEGFSVEELLRSTHPDAPIRRPIADFASLIDTSAISADLEWAPTARLRLVIDRA